MGDPSDGGFDGWRACNKKGGIKLPPPPKKKRAGAIRRAAGTWETGLKLINLFDQAVGRVLDHLLGLTHIHHAASPQAGNPVGIPPSPQVMTRGNGRKGAGVVVEARRVVNAGGFRRLFAVTHDAVEAVVEP